MVDLPKPSIELLPQRPPMLLVDQLTGCSATGSEASAVVGKSGLLFINSAGCVEPEAMIEMLAQTSAMDQGWRAEDAGEKRKNGLLAGMDHLGFTPEACGMQAGNVLHVAGEKTLELGDVSVFEGRVHDEQNRKLLTGNLKVWESHTLPALPDFSDKPPVAEKTLDDRNALSPIVRALRKSTFDMKKTSDDSVAAQGWLADDFPGCQGHFPGYPVLPAVVMVLWGRILGQELSATTLTPTAISRAKFGSIAGPGVVLSLDLKMSRQENGLFKASFKITADHGMIARIECTWQQMEGAQ